MQSKAGKKDQQWITSIENFYRDDKRDRKQRELDYIRDLEIIVQDDPKDVEAKAFLVFKIWENGGRTKISSYMATDALAKEVLAASPMHPAHHARIHFWMNEADRLQAAHVVAVPLGLRVIGSLGDDVRRGGGLVVLLRLLLRGTFVGGIKLRERFQVEPFAPGRVHAVRAGHGGVDEFARALFIRDICHRQPPAGHEAIGVELLHLAEGSLRLEVPEAVQLPDALVEKLLRQRVRGGDGEINLRHPLHQERAFCRNRM